jgi:DNA-binding response OmpR family regulator
MKMQGLSSDVVSDSSISARLLIVDDDAILRNTLRQQLASEGFNVVVEASTVLEVFERLPDANPDLILLGACLPDGNGLETCQKLRERGFAKPIVMLVGQNSEYDIVAALRAGATDFILKPMRMGELLAMVRLQLWQQNVSDTARVSISGLGFVPDNKLLLSADESKKVTLTEKEAKTLKYLYRAHPAAVTKEELLTEVWGFQTGLSTHTVETHIYRIRQKIQRICKKPVIMTTNTGYSLKSVP